MSLAKTRETLRANILETFTRLRSIIGGNSTVCNYCPLSVCVIDYSPRTTSLFVPRTCVASFFSFPFFFRYRQPMQLFHVSCRATSILTHLFGDQGQNVCLSLWPFIESLFRVGLLTMNAEWDASFCFLEQLWNNMNGYILSLRNNFIAWKLRRWLVWIS